MEGTGAVLAGPFCECIKVAELRLFTTSQFMAYCFVTVQQNRIADNRRVASRQTPYFLSKRQQKVSKKWLLFLARVLNDIETGQLLTRWFSVAPKIRIPLDEATLLRLQLRTENSRQKILQLRSWAASQNRKKPAAHYRFINVSAEA
ncbi:MAG: hypothetical protein KAT62_07480 [Desulfuromonadales bacterium]|nr:hypothetical protein [Desulfuromonadales bacterium]